MGCRWSVCGYEIGSGYQTCEYCSNSIPFPKGYYQIQDGVSVGRCFQTVLCQKCYHNKQLQLAGVSIPEYYSAIQQRFTGQPTAEFVFRRRMNWRLGDRYYYQLQRKIIALIAKHHESIQIISNRTNLCQEIARLHWKRVTRDLHETLPTAFEIEMFRILDETPYLYQKSNFIELEKSAHIQNKIHEDVEDGVITRMSV